MYVPIIYIILLYMWDEKYFWLIGYLRAKEMYIISNFRKEAFAIIRKKYIQLCKLTLN